MTLENLKYRIENKTLNKIGLIIFRCTDSTFLAHFYVDVLAKEFNLTPVVVDDLSPLIPTKKKDIFNTRDFDTSLPVYSVECLVTNIDYQKIDKAVVICNTVSGNTLDDYICDIFPLDKPVVEAYTRVKVPGVSEQGTQALCRHCDWDIDRISLECDKVSIFPVEQQDELFKQFIKDGMVGDLSTNTIYTLVDGISKRNIEEIAKVLQDLANIDVEPFGLLTLLISNFKKVLDVQSTSQQIMSNKNMLNEHCARLGISTKQFWGIKYNNCNYYSTQKLIEVYKFLLNIDKEIKTGKLPVSDLIDYIIVKIFTIGG